MTPERAKRFTDLVRSLQPNTLIDGRLGAEGDYVSTGDNVIPGEKRTEAWETPATINHTWGYRKDDVDWKTAGRDRLQARGHRQQGRQLPAERRADGRWRDSASRARTCCARPGAG